jgi:ankyrin repeat protein
VASRIQDAMFELFNPKKPHLTTWISIYNEFRDPTRWNDGAAFELERHPSPSEAASLSCALWFGLTGVTNYLIITHAMDVNVQYRDQGAPLHLASVLGHTGVVSLLLQHNADVNIRCTNYANWKPLHFAASHGHAKVAKLLLEHGADVNAQTEYQATPLWSAAQGGYLELVQLLLRNGADVHIRHRCGESSFMIARLNGHVDIAQLLVEHGAETE